MFITNNKNNNQCYKLNNDKTYIFLTFMGDYKGEFPLESIEQKRYTSYKRHSILVTRIS